MTVQELIDALEENVDDKAMEVVIIHDDGAMDMAAMGVLGAVGGAVMCGLMTIQGVMYVNEAVGRNSK